MQFVHVASASSSRSGWSLPCTAPATLRGGGGGGGTIGDSVNKSGMILRIRMTDGSMTRIHVKDGEEDKTTIARILSQLNLPTDDGDDDDDEKGGNEIKCKVGNNDEDVDIQKTVSELGLKHGSLLTIVQPSDTKENETTGSEAGAEGAGGGGAGQSKQQTRRRQAVNSENDKTSMTQQHDRFDPFPDLAKSATYTSTVRRTRAMSRGVKRGMSYGDISKIQSAMHVVEPQPNGPIKRVYMCHVGAARFQTNCIVTPTRKKRQQQRNNNKKKKKKEEGETFAIKNEIRNRTALLFGTIRRERATLSTPKSVRTSLSTPLSEREMCDVIVVHAVWEPPQNPTLLIEDEKEKKKGTTTTTTKNNYDNKEDNVECYHYDNTELLRYNDSRQIQRALRIATNLGLRPIGWMFAYSDDRHVEDDSLPVWGPDVITGAMTQINTMKLLGREEGKKFATLALDAKTGATEAFQLSDVCVQMVAEGILTPKTFKSGDTKLSSSSTAYVSGSGGDGGKKKKSSIGIGRFLTTSDPILIDSKETTELDSVLCLVNTAMLSHKGSFSGKEGENPLKKSGDLTAKTKKRILSALTEVEGRGENDDNCDALLEELCDFNVLMALDQLMRKEDVDELCRVVQKWSRGQRKGTVVRRDLRLVLQSVLGG